jgi:hypothetical protein
MSVELLDEADCDFLTRFHPKWPVFEGFGEKKKVVKV